MIPPFPVTDDFEDQMNLNTLLEMIASGFEDRVLLGERATGITGGRLKELSVNAGGAVQEADASVVVFLGGNGPAFPVGLFAAAVAGIPFLPVNYRLSDDQIAEILGRHERPFVIAEDPSRSPVPGAVSVAEWMSIAERHSPPPVTADPDTDEIAVVLMTSGTTAAPKSALLRHAHLTSYLLGSVEFAASDEQDATVVSVPPYHIAAVANLLSNLYSGRRILYLDQFTPEEWLRIVTDERVTHTMVVPTMLARIVAHLEASGTHGPSTLASMAYGGAKISSRVLRRALELFPETGFVNAYGLTETASSIAVLGPQDHRDALASDDPLVRARLGSVGKALPAVSIQVRDAFGDVAPADVVGDVYVKGAQVAGEYAEAGSLLDADGWFATRDRGHLDADGFLFIHGRADDTIIRGGENIAPAEIETVLAGHELVDDVAVAGVPDEEWGQRIAAFVVLRRCAATTAEELTEYVRVRLRSSKTPDSMVFLPELPRTPTGKLLRRQLVSDLLATMPGLQ
ncbi:MAG TPA: long-chain fatty acid--CoA ligase [Kineosporiaceae bacterium]